MSAQTTYAIQQALGYAGQIFDLGNRDVVSRSVEEAAGIGFGVAVSRGTDPDNQVIFGAAGAFFGVTVRDLSREGDAASAIEYGETETANIMRKGYIVVAVPAGCVPGDAAKYTDTTGVIDSGAPGAGETAIPGTFETTAVAGGLAVLRITG